MDWLLYIVFFLALTYLGASIYIRIKYPFWSFMDANHTYDWFLRRSGRPISIKPCRNKYVDRARIKTDNLELSKSFAELSKSFAELLQRFYIPSDKILYECETNNIEARMSGHNSQVSFHYELDYLQNLSSNPNGVIASYPVQIKISTDVESLVESSVESSNLEIPVNYISCVAASSVDIVRKLIATHIYNVHDKTPNIPAFILKKDVGRCSGLRPLTIFSTTLFYIGSKPKVEKTTVNQTTLVQVYKNNWHLIMDAVAGLTGFVALMDIGAIQARVKAGILYVYALMYRGTTIAMYFIENAHMLYEQIDDHGGKTLRLVGSLAYTRVNPSLLDPSLTISQDTNHLFYSGFCQCLRKIIKQNGDYKMLLVDSLGANHIILRYLEQDKQMMRLTTTTGAYYFVNWAYREVWQSDKVFMLV